MIVGLEPQTYNSPDMVFRVAGYDFAIYQRLVRNLEYKNRDQPEQTSMVLNGKKLPLVTTIVIWLSAEPWPGAKNLIEMLEVPEEYVMKLPYYPLHLIEPFALTNEELMKYGPEVGTVLVFIKNSKNQYQRSDELKKYEAEFSNVSPLAYDWIYAVTKIEFDRKIKIRNGVINMCEAIIQMQNSSRNEGFKIGNNEGIQIGKTEGIRIGEMRGKTKGIEIVRNQELRKIAVKLLVSGFSREDVANFLRDFKHLS
ncbi:hypothetical protein BO224_00020 [Erysipelotrichaceae bacterium NYU-BL-E8]|nr:hypothetical protein BO224_00020 [Erysipelotrichaceae bacterium NYU-BL-E8]